MTILYRAYDETDRLLYVGITDDWTARQEAHDRTSRWTVDVSRWATEEHADLAAAHAAELTAIRTENPVFNVSGRPRADYYDAVAEFLNGRPLPKDLDGETVLRGAMRIAESMADKAGGQQDGWELTRARLRQVLVARPDRA